MLGSTRRASLSRLMVAVFVALLSAMLILAGIIVGLQSFGFLIQNSVWITQAAEILNPILFTLSGIFGIWTLLLAYVSGWKSAD
ncbi:hypothetical protein SAMN05216593_102115 [Pseudomonas asturiensis]|uniref:Uncharacterized protein n=1 Tax=Pseudomonas asturiensis TaxID=1190415 RepID=A0A1M7KGW9_9PSED|nr:hypothetical protein SAMN05216593_102115 [Pseudomonas asturiensis]